MGKHDNIIFSVADILGGDVVLANDPDARDNWIVDVLDGKTIAELKADFREMGEMKGGSHACTLIEASGRDCDWQPSGDLELAEIDTPVPDYATLTQLAAKDAEFAAGLAMMRELDHAAAQEVCTMLASVRATAYIQTFMRVLQTYWPAEAARLAQTR